MIVSKDPPILNEHEEFIPLYTIKSVFEVYEDSRGRAVSSGCFFPLFISFNIINFWRTLVFTSSTHVSFWSELICAHPFIYVLF